MSINNPSTAGVTTTSNGTNNTIPKFTGANTVANSSIVDNGTAVTMAEQMNWTTGLGAITQVLGPTDQPLAIASANLQNVTVTSGNAVLTASNGSGINVNSFTVNGASGGQWTASGVISRYKSVLTVANGVPAEYAQVNSTGLTAAVTATTLYAVPAAGAGLYRISWMAAVTTAGSVSSVLGGTNGFQVVYTDADDSVVKTTPGTIVAGVSTNSTNSTSTGTLSGCIIVNAKASTNIQYQMDYTANAANSMVYSLRIRLEAL